MSVPSGAWAESLRNLPHHLRERSYLYSNGTTRHDGDFVLCWLHHAFRLDENPALDVASIFAEKSGKPLLIYQAVCEHYRYASDRHHWFMLEGIRDLQARMAHSGLSYVFHLGRPGHREPHLKTLTRQASLLVTEDFPLDPTMPWTERLRSTTPTPIVLVDSACVVPMLLVGKAYDRAFAFREATEKLYAERIDQAWPECSAKPTPYKGPLPFASVDLQHGSLAELIAHCNIDHAIGPVGDTRGGTTAGYERWNEFKKLHLHQYAKRRNDAAVRGVSRMSAYLHYGMVSPFRIAREAAQCKAEKYLDELLIWRELAYNFCRFRDGVETLEAIPEWARKTLNEHRHDMRNCLHSWEVSARGRTGDSLWDASQRSLLKHGELHNNLRMTWGKQILQWTAGPAEALARLQDLNHRYALDGRNPASYGGILWCLGQFDRPFTPPQPVIGTVRPRSLDEHLERIDFSKYRTLIDRSSFGFSPTIACIGAGLAGLSCVRTLMDHGLNVTLFDKSRSVGGRTAQRRGEGGWSCDHGAQYFTVRDRRLAKYAQSWAEDGVIEAWQGRVVELQRGVIVDKDRPQLRWVGTPAMNALARHLASGLTIQAECTISQTSRRDDGKYEVIDAEGKSYGPFDSVLYNLPAPQAAAIVPYECQWRPRLSEIEFAPCWAVMLVFESRLDVPLDGAFINEGPLRWIARDSSKPQRTGRFDTWVLHSCPEWSKSQFDKPSEWIIQSLCDALREATGQTLPEMISATTHRWRYAQPTKCLSEDCLWDNQQLLGACGDWCNGPRVEGALLSGFALAGRILGHLHEHYPPQSEHKPKQLSLL
jgi:photolyase PhrII